MRTLTWVLGAIAIPLLAAPAAEGAAPGRLDPRFGNHGRVDVSELGFQGGPRLGAETAIAPDGSILVATQVLSPQYQSEQVPAAGEEGVYLIPPPSYSIVLRRYFPSGALDSDFGTDGTFHVTAEPGYGFELNKLCVDSRGRPILLGTSFGPGKREAGLYAPGDIYPNRATIIRLTPDGARDPSFAGDGIALFDFGLTFERRSESSWAAAGIAGGAVDARDRVVLIANRTRDGVHGGTVRENALVARITPSGALDPQFGGGDGVYPLGDSTSTEDELTIGPSGGVNLFGPFEQHAYTGETELIRLTVTGLPDTSLGGKGSSNVPMDTDQIAIDPWGRTYLLGSWFGGQRKIARLNARGGLDHSFGIAGFASLNFQRFKPTAIVPDRSGGLFVVGSKDGQFAVIHRLPSGRPDRHFGNGGRVLTRFGADDDATAVEADLGRHGRLLVGGLVGRVADLPMMSYFLVSYLTG